jgi:hypothetical protein
MTGGRRSVGSEAGGRKTAERACVPDVLANFCCLALILHKQTGAGRPRRIDARRGQIMPSTQSGKPRTSIRKAPPATNSKTPIPKASKVAAPKARKTIARKPAGLAIGSTEWQQRVAAAAYFRAEARGFVGGSPEQDWFEAEAELRAGRPPVPIR